MAWIIAPFPHGRRWGVLALTVGFAFGVALLVLHAEVPPEAAREGPTCVGCHHGADEEAEWPSLGEPLGGVPGPGAGGQ